MIKRLVSSIFITAGLWAIAYLSEPQQLPQAIANRFVSIELGQNSSPYTGNSREHSGALYW
jgi:hypothetical protein